MKKLAFLFSASVILASCGGSNDNATVASDSTLVADSSTINLDSAKVDTLQIDSAKK